MYHCMGNDTHLSIRSLSEDTETGVQEKKSVFLLLQHQSSSGLRNAYEMKVYFATVHEADRGRGIH